MQQAIAESLSGAKLWKISRSFSEDVFLWYFRWPRACNRCKLGRGMWHWCDFWQTVPDFFDFWQPDFLTSSWLSPFLGGRDEIAYSDCLVSRPDVSNVFLKHFVNTFWLVSCYLLLLAVIPWHQTGRCWRCWAPTSFDGECHLTGGHVTFYDTKKLEIRFFTNFFFWVKKNPQNPGNPNKKKTKHQNTKKKRVLLSLPFFSTIFSPFSWLFCWVFFQIPFFP